MAIINHIEFADAAPALTRWLNERLSDAEDVRVFNLTLPDNGLSSETILFDATWLERGHQRRQRLAARIQPSGEAVLYSYNLANEARAMTALADHTKVPTPKIVGVETNPDVLGTPFLVMQCVEGRTPSDTPPFPVTGWVLDLPPAQQTLMHENALAALAELHGADWRRLGLDVLARPELGSDPLEQVLTYWQRAFEWGTEGQTNPVIEGAFDWVNTNRPNDIEPVVLSWGDSRIGNMIFAPDLSVAAVLDFDLATLASPELDLGWWLFVNRHHSEGFGVPLPPGIHDRAATIARYEELSGHSVRYDHFYEVLGALRFATLMVRAGHLMIKLGTLPSNHPMALNNPATQWLAATLDLPAPAGTTTTFLTGEGR